MNTRKIVRRMLDPGKPVDPLRTGDAPDALFEARWRDALKKRVIWVLCGLGLWTTGVEARLVYLQVLKHDEMVTLARRQHNREISLIPPRGDIVDRNGQMLAYSVDGHALAADPGEVDDPAATASARSRARSPASLSTSSRAGSNGKRRKPSAVRRPVCLEASAAGPSQDRTSRRVPRFRRAVTMDGSLASRDSMSHTQAPHVTPSTMR